MIVQNLPKVFFLLFLTLFGVLHVNADPATQEPVRIGLIAPLSGPFADWGLSIRGGFELGVSDSKNKFLPAYEDGECQPRKAVNAAAKMLTLGKTKLLVGPGCLAGFQAVAPIALKHNALLFSVGGLDQETVRKFTNAVDITTAADTEVRYLASYLASLEKIETIAVLHGSNAYGEQLASSFVSYLMREKIKVTVKEQLDLNTSDYKGIISRIQKDHPDAVFVHQSESSTGIFLKQIRQQGFKGRIFGPFTCESESLLKAAGVFANGLEYPFPLNVSEGSNNWEKFRQRYIAKFGVSPSPHSFMVYDGVLLLDKALDNCESSNITCITEFFVKLRKHVGVSGEISFDEFGGALRPFGIKGIRNGEFVWITRELEL